MRRCWSSKAGKTQLPGGSGPASSAGEAATHTPSWTCPQLGKSRHCSGVRTQTLAHSTSEGSPFPLGLSCQRRGLTERLWGVRALLPLAFRYLPKYLLMFPRADFKSSVICRLRASAQCQLWSSPRTWTLESLGPLGSLLLRPGGQLCTTALWWTGKGNLGLSPGLIPEPPLTSPRKCGQLPPAGTGGEGSRPVPGN